MAEEKPSRIQSRHYLSNSMAMFLKNIRVSANTVEDLIQNNLDAIDELQKGTDAAADHGYADLSLGTVSSLYTDFPRTWRRACIILDAYKVNSLPFVVSMDSRLLDLTLTYAPKAIKVDPVSAANALGSVLGAAALAHPKLVDAESKGFRSLKLTTVQEHFHRAVREVAKRFNEGENNLINSYLGEIVSRSEEDYRRRTFPHQATSASVALAHGGHTGGFRFVPRHGATEAQQRCMEHFALKPQGVPKGRRYEPVQSLLFCGA